MEKTLIETVNGSVDYVNEALRFVSRDKVFVAWNGKTIEKFFKTKKSAESYISKQQGHTYYDDYSQEMIDCGNGLIVDYVVASELTDLCNDKLIWYKEMKRNRTHLNNMDMVIREASRIGVNEEVIEFLNEIREEFMQNNSFTIFSEFEDSNTKTEAIISKTNEEIVHINNTEIVYEDNCTENEFKIRIINPYKNSFYSKGQEFIIIKESYKNLSMPRGSVYIEIYVDEFWGKRKILVLSSEYEFINN